MKTYVGVQRIAPRCAVVAVAIKTVAADTDAAIPLLAHQAKRPLQRLAAKAAQLGPHQAFLVCASERLEIQLPTQGRSAGRERIGPPAHTD